MGPHVPGKVSYCSGWQCIAVDEYMFHCLCYVACSAFLTCFTVGDVFPVGAEFLGAMHGFVQELFYTGAYIMISGFIP